MRQHKFPSLKLAQKGVVIIEALIAILIFSFALLGLVGLQAIMIKNTGESEFRAVASYIAQQQVGQMWANPSAIPALVNTTINVSSRLPNGSLTITQPAVNQYTITVTWQKQGEDMHNFSTIASIVGN
jgi:type IV pilus assembly protein PilV